MATTKKKTKKSKKTDGKRPFEIITEYFEKYGFEQPRKDALAALIVLGVNPGTAKTQYQKRKGAAA